MQTTNKKFKDAVIPCKFLLTLGILTCSHTASASLLDVFRLEDGHTNWQYVANSVGGTLIIVLSLAAVGLLRSRKRALQSSQALAKVRDELEVRVQERTANLETANQLLQESNQLLETEIAQHKATGDRLSSTEAYIKNIIQSMPLVLIGVNKDGLVTQWNHRAVEVTGVKTEDAMGHNLWQIYPAITITPDHIVRALTNDETITIKHSQRGQYYFDITIYPLREQIEIGVVVLIDDVSQNVLAEHMLIQRDKMSSLGELAAGMAHDINNPLRVILQSVQTVQRNLTADFEPNQKTAREVGADLEQLSRYLTAKDITPRLDDARDAGKRATAIVNNLLNFAGSRGQQKQPANVIEIIENTLELAEDVLAFEASLRFQDIHIERSYPEELADFPCFAAELQQVFLNLFRNASHALQMVDREGHKPTIKIRVYEQFEMLKIEIEDNGVGISEAVQEQIFEPFFTTTEFDSGQGTGLGLSVSYFIITEHHQGNIAVTSRLGEGTTFHIQMLRA